MDRRRIVPPDEYPWWVQFSLLGVPDFIGPWLWLWFFFWLSLATAVGLIAFGLFGERPLIPGYGFPWERPLFVAFGPLMATAALSYWLTIRWIDRHGSWGPSD